MNQTNDTNQIIILDTNRDIVGLVELLGTVIHYLKRNSQGLTSLDLLLEPLEYETDALANLSTYAMDIAAEIEIISDSRANICTTDIAREIYNYGKELYNQLRLLRLYEAGNLRYEYHDWYANYLVLRRKPVRVNPSPSISTQSFRLHI